MSVTENELVKALAAAVSGNASKDARTLLELAAETGWTRHAVSRALRALHTQGRLQAHRVPRPAIDGVDRMVAAYTIRPAP